MCAPGFGLALLQIEFKLLDLKKINTMSELEALIFDVDGTLADTEDVHRQSFNRAFAQSGLSWEWSPQLYGCLKFR